VTLVYLAIGVVIGLAVGALSTALICSRRRSEIPAAGALHENELLRVRGEEAASRAELTNRIAGLEAELAGIEREVAQHESRYRDIVERHALEAQERQRRDAEQSLVLQALTPVQESLRTMRGKVDELERERTQQYGELREQLTATRASTDQVRLTAESLASSLRNTSVRGAWGEAQLRRLVESAGLTNQVDFDLQATSRTDDGVRRPDLVIRLPEGKSIAIDAKVPLARFIEANEIPVTATGPEADRRDALLKEHVKAVRAHIDALGAKGYWTDLDSPEFVVAFLPSESLLSAALATDPSLMDYSFGKKVLLASPVNLWAVLKTVSYTWNQQRLTDDAHRLFDLSETLYARLRTLAERAEGLRGAIESTVKRYNEFASTLETRVLVTARQINRLDESKILGEPGFVDQTPRPLTAPELLPVQGDVASVEN
jgi:DNA recombination protein RmuC